MAHIIADRVRETTVTTGTGALTLDGAATGFRAFADVCATDDTAFYCISGGSEWEVGLGTYSAADTLTRTAVIASSNSGAAVSLSSGTKDVFLTDPAVAQPTMMRPKRSGTTYYDLPGVGLRGWLTQTYEGGRIHYIRFHPKSPRVVNEIRFRITSAAAGGNTGRVSLYLADEDAQPGALVAGVTGLDITTTGAQSASITGTRIWPRPYVLGWWATADVTLGCRYGTGLAVIRPDLDEYDLIWSTKVYRDPSAFTTWADPGTPWSDADNTNQDFIVPLFLDIT